MQQPTNFVLDYSTWRCGNSSIHQLGEGPTRMKNQLGFMCCLGQASSQFSKDVTEQSLLNSSTPGGVWIDIRKDIPLLSIHNGVNSELSNKAMTINDEESTTPDEKIELLTALFAEQGVEMTVINKPSKQN